MIYFLINNDYHLSLDMKLAEQLPDFELGLIQIPYSLNILSKSEVFSKIFTYHQRVYASLYRLIMRPKEILNSLKIVDKELTIRADDILLVHTELDVLNQYVIQKFYKANAKIYLLEDGTATMCYFSTPPQAASFMHNIRAFILNFFYGFKYTSIKKYGAEILPVMDDNVFNGMIVSFGDKIDRKIPLYKLRPFDEPIEVKFDNGAIFFSQPVYFWFCTEHQYIKYIDDLMAVAYRFERFYFKFHPSDTENVKRAVTRLIKEKYSYILIIIENDIAEKLIIKYPVKYAITFNSTAVFNLMNRGIVPIFLNSIFSNTYNDSSFVVFDQFLRSIGCKYPISLSEVKPGFIAFDNDFDNTGSMLLSDILKQA